MTDLLDEYTPQFNESQEKAIVGSLMLDFSLIRILREQKVTVDDFFLPSCKAIIEVMLDDHHRFDTSCDPVSLARELEVRGMLEKIGGNAKLHEMYTDIPRFAATDEPFRRWVFDLKEDARKRSLSVMAQKMLLASQNGHTSKEILEEFSAESAYLLTEGPDGEDTMEALAYAVDDEVRRRVEQKDAGLRIGIPYLDVRLGGLQKGHFCVLAALASQGKTTTAMQITMALLEQQAPVVVFSMEMSRLEITEKLWALHSELTRTPFIMGAFTDEERAKYQEGYQWISTLSLRVRDSSVLMPTMDAIEREMRFLAKRGVRVAVIDYIGLLRSGARHNSRQEEVAMMSRRLKNLAQETGMVILCLAQLKRDADSRHVENDRYGGRKRKKLFLSDLADSSGIERDADQVLFVQTDEDDGEVTYSDASLTIMKNRHGRCGSLDGQLNRKLGRYDWGD